MATKKKRTLLPRVTSLGELQRLARTDARYQQLAIISAENLGQPRVRSPRSSLDAAMRWLRVNADETDNEQGVVDEVNACRDLVTETTTRKVVRDDL